MEPFTARIALSDIALFPQRRDVTTNCRRAFAEQIGNLDIVESYRWLSPYRQVLELINNIHQYRQGTEIEPIG